MEHVHWNILVCLIHINYHISLIRADGRETEIWGFNIQDTIPIVPVPLKKPDKDVLLNISETKQIT